MFFSAELKYEVGPNLFVITLHISSCDCEAKNWQDKKTILFNPSKFMSKNIQQDLRIILPAPSKWLGAIAIGTFYMALFYLRFDIRLRLNTFQGQTACKH